MASLTKAKHFMFTLLAQQTSLGIWIGHLSEGSRNVFLVPLADHATRLNMLKLYSSNLQIDDDVDLHELARLGRRVSQEATYATFANPLS